MEKFFIVIDWILFAIFFGVNLSVLYFTIFEDAPIDKWMFIANTLIAMFVVGLDFIKERC